LYKALSTLAILVAVFGDIVADFGRGRRRVDEV